MTKLRIPRHALILVCDGRKALFLRNEGDTEYPNLQVVDVLSDKPNPRTAEQGTDRPGRVIEGATGRHSAMEQTDWHELEERAFARDVAAALEARQAAGHEDKLIIVAPPRTLAELRISLSGRLKDKLIAELQKDLTNHPVYEIERLLTAA